MAKRGVYPGPVCVCERKHDVWEHIDTHPVGASRPLHHVHRAQNMRPGRGAPLRPFGEIMAVLYRGGGYIY
jgi:hypothetical protein